MLKLSTGFMRGAQVVVNHSKVISSGRIPLPVIDAGLVSGSAGNALNLNNKRPIMIVTNTFDIAVTVRGWLVNGVPDASIIGNVLPGETVVLTPVANDDNFSFWATLESAPTKGEIMFNISAPPLRSRIIHHLAKAVAAWR